jgi:S1-C subfamily serine protease
MPDYSRVCPSCGRRVPQTVLVCRCGLELPRESPASGPAVEGPAGGSWRWPIIAALAASGGVLVGAYLMRAGGSTPSPAGSPTSAPTVAVLPVPAAALPPEPPSLEVVPAQAPDLKVGPTSVAAQTDDVRAVGPSFSSGVSPSPALEDVLARVMPAVVLVEASNARGSAFFVAPDTLLTNVHVVGGSSSVTVRRMGGETASARVAATASQFDIAVLKVSTPNTSQPTLLLGSVNDARIGQEVVAIGSALGMLQNTVTRGIVSGVRQTGDATLVQTDAAINPGNSGGPLLDRTGRVIGITTMGFKGSQGLNFAVAIDHARALLEGRYSSTPPPGSAAAVIPSMRSLSPALPSETEQARTEGMKMYEETLAQLAKRADALDNAFRSFQQSCYEGRVNAASDRQWFALFDDRSMQGAVAPGCGGWFNDVRREANDIRNGVIAAEEEARRSDVYPGFRREARRRYRLDYPGWDR